MHGSLKVYSGAAAAARHYVEADRGRADDYYLTEGTGVARRFTATEGRVIELAPLTGDAYEAWVAGRDPDTGEPRGRLRTDGHAVRFVEVVVNGPKSWSLASVLHPDVAAAYDAAQDRAAEQIIAWLSEHATTRIGPRGGQVQLPLQVLEAAAIRHYTSRANDPHRHLHLQFSSRVFAAGKWRGLHTVGVRDAINAINGIGHAAMDTDPELNAAFAAHGYTKSATGEIRQLDRYVGPMSARATQIEAHLHRYEREWTAAHPGETPGPALRRVWHHRAWAEGRPDKVAPQPGTSLDERWRAELADLGFRAPARPVPLAPTAVGALDRDRLAQRALARLAAGRSAWNPADVRGELERLIAAAGVVVDAGVRIELAEDLTARAMIRCVPLLERDGVPEHIRAWTSRPVLAVEAELTARLGARAAAHTPPAPPVEFEIGAGRLDADQAAVVAALAGDRALLVVEGPAGAGKTTTLAATRGLLELSGHRLLVVTPTLKAAKVAQAEVGTAAGSAARLAFDYGWRWDEDGAWTRLAVGDTDPVTGHVYAGPSGPPPLQPRDLLVIDEAGMLDQDTARAVFTVADECRARVALLGDRHQLAAVGRGGVLDLAIGQIEDDAYLTLGGVHRFVRTDATGRTTPDTGYADLTRAMRAGEDPGTVFDALLAREQIHLHPDPDALRQAVADTAAAAQANGERIAVVVDTRGQAAALNTAIRDRLVAAGRVDDLRVLITRAGQRIGVGDRIVTRRNDAALDVANHDTWLVARLGRDGTLLVTPEDAPESASWQGARVLPAAYGAQHAELAYASTAHGAQGDTVTTGHLVIGEHTGAATAYVGMTRGRQANTAHLVAADVDEAREQWIAVFARDRADLGPTHAAREAAAEAARYTPARPVDDILADLRAAWTVEQNCLDRLAFCQPQREQLREVVALDAPFADQLATLKAVQAHAASSAEQARERAEASQASLDAAADRIRAGLLRRCADDRGAARAAAQIVLEGPGRLGLRRAATARARAQLTDWADRWRPHMPSLPADTTELARRAGWFDDRSALWAALDTSARAQAHQAHPEHTALRADADAAQRHHDQAGAALARARRERYERLKHLAPAAWTPDPQARLADLEGGLVTTRERLTDARASIARLTAEPALLAQPPDRLSRERDAWRTQRDAVDRQRRAALRQPTISRPPAAPPRLSPGRPGAHPSPGR